ncbi:MAG TPA: aldehyde dehydrogenase family protein [Thermoanaerobaculales bacterium]|nr:aldehyde dehydrogenase family protein [Thermoanaerobaculales bacterium]HQL30948.1 aldehyde dehydrogenase family protein [Thermoanaerobaculales bacterium]
METFTVGPVTGATEDRRGLDRAIGELRAHADEWARLGMDRKLAMLLATRRNLGRCGRRWVDASVAAKRIDPRSPWVGEEWVVGPWALAATISGYLDTLSALAAGRLPGFRGATTRADGRLIVPVFPRSVFDRLLLSGVTAEVWMQPGITAAELEERMASFYREPEPRGRVALVLGAGNVNGIAPLDALYRLIGRGQAVLLKMSPVNAYLAPILEEVLEPFVAAGYLRVVSGGAEVGEYLTRHDGIDEVHITGSAATHDAIVWGAGEQAAERRRRGEPLLGKPITSELGGVGPVIVVPGPWSAADLRYQAEHVVTMKLHNGGCNCVSAQVLVLPREWPLQAAFMGELRRLLRELPPRAAHYPGAADRQRAAAAVHPDAELFAGEVPRTLITGLDPESAAEHCFSNEAFGEVLAVVDLPGGDASSFLDNAVAFCNRRLAGTLGVTVLVHPRTMREEAAALDRAIADLEYGGVGVNIWCAIAFLLAQATWGAYPGHTIEDVGSGIGVVHNSFLIEGSQKTVARASFYPFPRSWVHGNLSLLPKPPWFVTNRTAHITARRVAGVAADPAWRRIPGIFASALRG